MYKNNLKNVIKYPSSDTKVPISPSGGKVTFAFFSFTRNVIRRWYSLLEVPQRRIYNANAMSICVAFGNKVVDTRDWHSQQGVPPKYDFDSGMQCGRSMIEMLGVLAIIAVLSVGGIAGYSKAMEKFKVNKAIGEYSYLIQGLLEHLQEIKYLSPDNTQIAINGYIQAAHLIPETWKVGNNGLIDTNGNTIYVFSRNDTMIINFYLGGITNTTGEKVTAFFSDKLCIALFQNLGQPLHEAVTLARTSKWGHGDKLVYFYGDAYCGGNKKCLKDATLVEMKEACGICDNTNSWCNFTLEF